MRLNYRKIFNLRPGLEYSELSFPDGQFLCLQGIPGYKGRIMAACRCARRLSPSLPESMPRFLSCEEKGPIVSALFSHLEAGTLSSFLRLMPREFHYTAGRRAGWNLSLLQQQIDFAETKKALNRQKKFLERIAEYVANAPHFRNDRYVLDALSLRYDHFKIFRPVVRYGMLRHDRLLINREGQIVFLPSPSFGPGCLTEDFALLECESARQYPEFCSGCLDGYFKGKIPAEFWFYFAMQSAVYSVWHLSRKVRNGRLDLSAAQSIFDRVRGDFDNFSKSIPGWYLSPEVARCKETVARRHL